MTYRTITAVGCCSLCGAPLTAWSYDGLCHGCRFGDRPTQIEVAPPSIPKLLRRIEELEARVKELEK